MAKKIIPLIYAITLDEFNEKLGKVLGLSDEIQIDIMDGEFVKQSSFDINEVKSLPSGKNFEIHLMASHPLEYIGQLKRLGIKKVVFHNEIDEETADVVDGFKKEGLTVFLAINPESEPVDIEKYIPKIDGVMLMSVKPGMAGQMFIHSVLGKAKYFKEKYPELVLEIDGGINRENIKEVFDSGVDIVGVGSGFFNASDPQKEWEELGEILNPKS